MTERTRILVTGAGGFIGSHLVERLARDGHVVRAFVRYNSRNHWGNLELIDPQVRDEVQVLTGDITDPFSVRRAMQDIDVVFHLAALIAIPYSYVAPQSYVATNVQGALNVLEAARDRGTRQVILTSTSECYGSARYVPIDELHPLQGQSPYSASKIAADMVGSSYARSFGLPVSIVRPFNTFGPRQSARAVIPTIIAQALSGGTIKLGSLTPTRDMNYVDNTIDGFLAALGSRASEGEVINVGSGREISIGDLAQLIVSMTNSTSEITADPQRIRPVNSEVERLLCDHKKATRLLGWSPRVSLEDGLVHTIEWIGKHLSQFKSHLYNI